MNVIPIFLRRACAAIVVIVAALAAGLAAAEEAAVSFRRDVIERFADSYVAGDAMGRQPEKTASTCRCSATTPRAITFA